MTNAIYTHVDVTGILKQRQWWKWVVRNPYSKVWLERQLDYLSHCQKHQRGVLGEHHVCKAISISTIPQLQVTNAQAKTIKDLYSQVLEFDKQPITFRPRQVKQPRGRFTHSKKNQQKKQKKQSGPQHRGCHEEVIHICPAWIISKVQSHTITLHYLCL